LRWIQWAEQPSRLPGERPGSICGMGTDLRRCGRIFDVSICPRHLMKSADWVYAGYQIDNMIMLRYNYGYADLIAPRVKAISGGSADRRNTEFAAVLLFAEPASAQDFRQSQTSSADNFLQKQEKQRGGLWCRSRRDMLPAPPGPLARGMARQQHRRTGPAIRCCAPGRTARCRAGDGDKTTC
jgi:hypothetical protein